MKNRKIPLWIAALFACSALFSEATRKDEITLVLVPREDSAVQLGMDIANRYPTLLVSYQLGANGAASLHGWTGTQWVNVSVADFQAGNFFKKGPDSTLVVEKAGVAIPEKLIPPVDWSANVAKITTVEMRPLLHLVGQYYDFSYKDWDWFSKRYGMDVDAINPEGLNISWYQKPLNEHLKTKDSIGGADLQYWVFIRQAVVPEPVEMEEPVELDGGEPVEDPFTNAAPEAVIMGAADASAESVNQEEM